MDQIVEKNLERMVGGEMDSVLSKESMGGNAGSWKGMSCAGVNFYYDIDDGEIMGFGNLQNMPRYVVDNYPNGSFWIAYDLRRIIRSRWKDDSRYIRIAQTFLANGTSEEAKKNIEESARLWNELYGFPEPQ